MRARRAIALLAAALLIGCGGDSTRLAAPQTLHGDAPAPDFALRNVDGRVVRLSQYPPTFRPAWIVHDVPLLAEQ